ncbi:hypothetical protein G7B40_021045 [Aetokthonos hydrillicola Thurmond2011]|jgi:hypothetical protein|uniref:Uncharacterized protein n=1 Tax=Aetokthonos hydrillicola Thurmond2011 TaxID=2712845 RepID=A0AAP5M9A1_9CYAN|nr:hypothetical protein [Aetokthonos hydrillicola]MBO3458660.1 hypothetical protein [Aetokthonos hydrillicola CCALA 1050]MBW4588013.1 hypothetical protein [Aetokthonos hydrillicola CCALA 1050]MDR9897035.1 hypothetical protein [Aetokthonos hydrillicola Thurmond2011]
MIPLRGRNSVNTGAVRFCGMTPTLGYKITCLRWRSQRKIDFYRELKLDPTKSHRSR